MWPRVSIVAGLWPGSRSRPLVARRDPRPRPGPGARGDARARAVAAGPRRRRRRRRRRVASGAALARPSGQPVAPRATDAAGRCSTSASRPRPLVVPQVGGGTIDLANLRGKPVWVNFMGTYCPPCVDEFPLMNGFAARYADDGLVVLAIDVEEEEGIVAAFAESSTRPSRSASTPTAAPRRRGTPSPCRSTSGSTPTGSSATARSVASGRTSWPAASDDPARRRRHAVTAAPRGAALDLATPAGRRAGDRPTGRRPGRRSSSSSTSTGRWPSARATRRRAGSSRPRSARCGIWHASRPSAPDRVVVAVLTGRTVADVAARVRVGGIDYLGDHGLQLGFLRRGGAGRPPARRTGGVR